MAKTYIPSLMREVHKLSVFLARYNSILRPAISIADPDAVAAYDDLRNAVTALDAVYQVLYPLGL